MLTQAERMKKMNRNDVKCVLISDVHFNNNTIQLASTALKSALQKSIELEVPLVIAGDLHDTKAMLRAECVNAILTILRDRPDNHRVVVLVGNHDMINEKGSIENHALHFLYSVAEIVQAPVFDDNLGLWLIPYHSNSEELQILLNSIPEASTLIMHQGVQTAFMGEYVVDKSSLPKESFANFRVISGHYHRAQDIKCGRPRIGAVGLFSYIGTPYTVSFAEANDGPKGYQLLLKNGLLNQIPLKLRKHVVLERSYNEVLDTIDNLNPVDLLWMKVRGPKSVLSKLSKKEIGKKHLGHEAFKLDLIPDKAEKVEADSIYKLSDDRILDKLIDESEETENQKKYLKDLWREILK